MVFPPVDGAGVRWGSVTLPVLVQGRVVRHMITDEQFGRGVAGRGGVQGRARGRGVQGVLGNDCPREGAAPEGLGQLVHGSLVRVRRGGTGTLVSAENGSPRWHVEENDP